MKKLGPVLPALLLPLLLAGCAGGGGEVAGSESPAPRPLPVASAWGDADARALSAPHALVRDPTALAAYLTQGARDDTEKARAIFRWLAENVAYDYANMSSTAPIDPAAVLVEGKSICDGYAGAFELLGRLAGLEVVTIHGWAKGYDWTPARRFRRTNHAWNAVRSDGTWRLIDSTWGAGYVREGRFVKELDDYFFMPAPEALAYTHLPEDPHWALVAQPLSRAAFEAQPVARSAFFRAGFTAADARAALALPGGTRLVDVFLAPDQPFFFRAAPAEAVLSVGRSYRFEVRVPAGARVAVVNGGRWQFLRPENDLLVASVTARPGPIYVTARTPADERFRTLLRYEAR